MTTYLVDYENTSHHGLEGCSVLPAEDTVTIFLGAKNTVATLPFDLVEAMTSGTLQCKITWKRSQKSGSNYLDMQLATHLGMLAGDQDQSETEYVIVSKDQGYAASVDFLREQRPDISISVRSSITLHPPASAPHSTATETDQASESTERPGANTDNETFVSLTVPFSDQVRASLRNSVKEIGLQPHQYSVVYRAFELAQTPNDFNHRLQKILGNELAGTVYRAVKMSGV